MTDSPAYLASMLPSATLTADDLLHLNLPNKRTELVRGDLVVEVLSPDDRPGEVLAKIADWLRAGTQLVWVVDPARHAARVYRADGSESLAAQDGMLDGEDVVPGFVCRLSEVV